MTASVDSETLFAAMITAAQQRICQSLNGIADPKLKQRKLWGNSPFYWPATAVTKKHASAILCIHGLYESPFIWHDLARSLNQNYTLASVLLPGHGCQAADLLTVHYCQWLASVKQAIAALKKTHTTIYLAGYSLGGLLAIACAQQDPAIKALILFAPALALAAWRGPLLQLAGKLMPLLPALRWYRRRAERNLFKYNSFATNAALQVKQLMQQVVQGGQTQAYLSQAIFLVATAEDEVVSYAAMQRWFLQQENPANAMLVYAAKPPAVSNAYAKINYVASAAPAHHILDYSHAALVVSPENSYYGAAGEYQDFDHYTPAKYRQYTQHEVHYGAVSWYNLRHYFLQRLTYNPRFASLTASLQVFLSTLEKNR